MSLVKILNQLYVPDHTEIRNLDELYDLINELSKYEGFRIQEYYISPELVKPVQDHNTNKILLLQAVNTDIPEDAPKVLIYEPHTNEPFGSRTMECLAQFLNDNHELWTALGCNFYFIFTIDPKGKSDNEGWFDNPYNTMLYWEQNYRTDPDIEWDFPSSRSDYIPRRPETKILIEIMKKGFDILFPTHNGIVGGTYFLSSERTDEIYVSVIKSALRNVNMPLHPHIPRESWEEMYEYGFWAIDSNANVSRKKSLPQYFIQESGSKHPTTLVIYSEVPRLRADPIPYGVFIGTTKRDIWLDYLDKLEEVINFIEERFLTILSQSEDLDGSENLINRHKGLINFYREWIPNKREEVKTDSSYYAKATKADQFDKTVIRDNILEDYTETY